MSKKSGIPYRPLGKSLKVSGAINSTTLELDTSGLDPFILTETIPDIDE